VEFQFSDELSATAVQIRTVGSGNQNPRGITPTTVCGVPSSIKGVPTMDGSLPNSCHRP
jgi:hypothetical protein